MMIAPAGDAHNRMYLALRDVIKLTFGNVFASVRAPFSKFHEGRLQSVSASKNTSGLQQSVRFMLLAASLTDMMDHGFTV